MLPILTALVLTIPLAGPAAPSKAFAGAALREAREDILLPTKRRIRIEQDVFDATVTLRTKGAGQIARLLSKSPSQLCPSFDADKKLVVLHCESRRVIVKVIKRKRKRYLRIERLRGVRPRGEGALPRISYVGGPSWLELQGRCPGKRTIIKAECLYVEGKRVSAARLFKEELHGEHAALAALRLGDISREAGRFQLALGWYRQAGRTGPFARVAMARRCSLLGGCFDVSRDARTYSPLDPAALPGAIRDEVILTGAQVLLFDDRPREAALHLLDVGMAGATGNPCRLAKTLCAKIAREVLRKSQFEPDPLALAFYYALPGRTDAKDAVEMARLASSAAATYGAPATAAHLLAASTSRVKRRELPAHLEDTARLYLEGNDTARARAVVAFADEVDARGKSARKTLRRKVRRQPRLNTVPYTDRAPSPEEVRAHGVLFAAERALTAAQEKKDKAEAQARALDAEATRGAALAEPKSEKETP